MIRVVLPAPLRTLARVDGEVTLDVEGPATQRSVLDAIETRYPMLRGTIRDHVTQQRRPFVRFFACEQDFSHEPPDAPLPDAVASGREPFFIVGAIAGGSSDDMESGQESVIAPLATVVHVITTMELGGAQQSTLYAVANLDCRMFRLVLVAGPEGTLWSEANALSGVEVHCVPSLHRAIHPLRDIIALAALVRILRSLPRDRPLIVHTHSSKAGVLGRLAAWLAHVPIVIHSIHGYGFHRGQCWLKRRVFVAVEWLMAAVTTHFIAVSDANIRDGRAWGFFRRSGVTLIRSGIQSRAFRIDPSVGAALRKEFGVAEHESLVGMVACLKPQKAPLDFITLAAKVRDATADAKFLLVGDGELREDVQRLVVSLGLKDVVILAGWRRDIASIMSALDVFVLTSRWEGLPRAVLEAIAAGVPVVATAVDGTVEAVRNIAGGARGLLVESGDIETMAERVFAILRHACGAPERMAHGVRLPEEYDIDYMVQQQNDLYRTLLSA